MCLLNCARVKDHLHDSWNWPRSPFDSSNFVRLSSTLRILGFHSNWMEISCRVVLKCRVNVIGRNACALAWLNIHIHDLVYGTRWTNPPFPSLMMLRSYGPQRFWATNSTLPCDHQNQLDKPSMIYCVTWLCKFFPLPYGLFRGFYKLKPKLVSVTN